MIVRYINVHLITMRTEMVYLSADSRPSILATGTVLNAAVTEIHALPGKFRHLPSHNITNILGFEINTTCRISRFYATL